MQNKLFFTEETPSSRKDDENKIDLSQIFNFLKRHKFFIATITGSTVFLSGLYSFFPKPVWHGEFQIVISGDKKGDFSDAFNKFVGVAAKNELNTQVEILKSPSILMPIFQFVKNEKKSTKFNIDNWSFKTWKKENIKVALESGTTILNIKYYDHDKEVILPTLNKISQAYQSYTDSKRKKEVENVIKYLENQIKLYKLKSDKALINLLDFSYENQINLRNNTSFEDARIQNAYKEKIYKKIKKQLDKNYLNAEELISYSTLFPELNKYFLEIEELDKNIALRENLFNKNDPNIILLKKQKDINENLLIKKISEVINSKINLLETEKEVVISKEKLLKVRELEIIAERESETLKNLETQFVKLSLEKAKSLRPWELITKPTLLDSPVSPRKFRILAIGLVMGTFISILICLYKDERSDLLFSSNSFIEILNLPPEFLVEINNAKELVEIPKLILDRLSPQKNRINFIKVGFIDENIINKVKQSFKEVSKDNEVIISDDFSTSNKSDFQFFICDFKKVLRSELIEMNKKIVLQGNTLKGCFLINNID
tara:strand:+ start:6 stop:1643 length:1638 start_codon:yes stop_codon:yes gene_type:complete